MDRENHRHAVLGSAVVANFGQFGARVAISPFVLAIAVEFGRSKGEIGGWPLAVGVLIALLCVAAALVVGNRLLGFGL